MPNDISTTGFGGPDLGDGTGWTSSTVRGPKTGVRLGDGKGEEETVRMVHELRVGATRGKRVERT